MMNFVIVSAIIPSTTILRTIQARVFITSFYRMITSGLREAITCHERAGNGNATNLQFFFFQACSAEVHDALIPTWLVLFVKLNKSIKSGLAGTVRPFYEIPDLCRHLDKNVINH